MSLTILSTYCAALFVAAAIPGPGMTAILARALGSSFAATVPMGLGLVLGDLVYLNAVILGLAVVAQTFGLAFMLIKYAGAAYLAWLAFRLWRSGIHLSEVAAERAERPWLTFLSGLFITLGNPKTMLFYLALAPSIVDFRSVSLLDYLVLVSATALVLIAVLIPYMALAARIRSLMNRPRPLTILNRVAATFMAGSALAIAARAS